MQDFKLKTLEQLLEQVRTEVAVLEKSARAAHDEATHDETKSEGKYDTRAIEAAYLAGAQFERLRLLVSQLSRLEGIGRTLVTRETLVVALGSLVQISGDLGTQIYMVLPCFGGESVEVSGRTVKIITPEAELGRELIGLEQGEEGSLTCKKVTRDFCVENIW